MIRRTAWACAAAVLAALMAACGGNPPTGPGPVGDPPVVQSITPNFGPAAGGTAVTIRGLRFEAGAAVTIGGQPATEVVVRDSSTITAKTAPAAGARAADVVVTVGGRSGTLPAGFRYEVPPTNNPPVINSITAQGTRPNEPPNFADLDELISVTANVRDDETPVDQLELQWSATVGTFTGTGASVTWLPPASVMQQTPIQVTLTLKVIERYGTGGIFSHEVTGTRAVALHDSAKEVGDMARRFLEKFSEADRNTDSQDIMRDFSFTAGVCPDLREVENERLDVIDHYTNFTMNRSKVGSASVRLDFRGTCFGPLPGDACISVPVEWESTHKGTRQQRSTAGIDHLTGVYSTGRWWLCSSRYEPGDTLGHAFYWR